MKRKGKCGTNGTQEPYEYFFFAIKDPGMNVTQGRRGEWKRQAASTIKGVRPGAITLSASKATGRKKGG